MAVLGVSALIGWALDIELLKSVAPGLSTLKANTAICFLLSAAGLWFAARSWKHRLARAARTWLPVAAGVVGALTLLEYAAGLDLHIDQLLVRDPDSPAAPGRMSAVTAFEFVTFAAAMLLSHHSSRLGQAGFLTTTSIGFLAAFLVCVGYLYGLRLLYAPFSESSVAIHTAAGFLVLFAGTAALRPDIGWIALLRASSLTGDVARWLLPAVVLIPLLLGWAVLQGTEKGLYQPRDGIALFALGCVAALGAVVWAGGAYANRLSVQLERHERVFKTVVETALDAFILMDEHGRILEWNPEAERLFGWRREEALGRTVIETIVPEAARGAHAAGLARFLATGEAKVLRRRVELNAQRRSGEQFAVELMVLPMREEAGWLFCGFVKDLSAWKEAEAQLRQAQKMDAVGQLTGGVAHDFNNLLTVVIATLDNVLPRASRETQPALENALRAAERGATLVKQLLAFSRKQPLSPEAIDLNSAVSGMLEILQRTVGEQIEIQIQLAPDAWRAFADKSQVDSALLNLAINARDAMPEGGKLTIETGNAHLDEAYAARNTEVAPGDYVVLAVSDTGVGMPPNVVERAMEPFFTTKPLGKGSGLGLSMIYGFAKQSAGHLKIYSEPGQGTTVRLYLPRLQGEPPEAARAAPQSEGTHSPRAGEVILVVEDDAQVRAVAALQLRELGYEVLEASDAASARAILSGPARIDLLFTDVVMRGESGRALAEAAQRACPGLKVLFTSGYTDNAIVHHGRLDPDVHFLAKPYRRDDLALKVRSALDKA